MTEPSQLHHRHDKSQGQQELRVGQRCAVRFVTKAEDFWCEDRTGCVRPIESWYPATIDRIRVLLGKILFSGHFDDNVEFTDVAASDVRALRSGTKESLDEHIDYWTKVLGGDETEFCNRCPTMLHPGDVVSALFQQGQVPVNPNAWHRGRIVDTKVTTKRCKLSYTVDIAYDDGDLEHNVPGNGGYVTLLERGNINPFWLEGLTVSFRSATWRTCTTGVIQSANPTTQLVAIKYEKSGKEIIEEHPYKHVVETFCKVDVQSKDGREFDWNTPLQEMCSNESRDMDEMEIDELPTISPPPPHTAKNQRVPRTATSSNTATRSPRAVIAPRRTPPVIEKVDENHPVERNKRNTVRPARYTESSSDDDEDDEKPLYSLIKKKGRPESGTIAERHAPSMLTPKPDCKSTPQQSAAAAVVSQRATLASSRRTTQLEPYEPPEEKRRTRTVAQRRVNAQRSNQVPFHTKAEMLDDVPAVPETTWNEIRIPRLPESPIRPLKRMDHSMAKHLSQALNSDDGVLGAELLTFMGAMHDRMPNDAVWQSVLALNCRGPSSCESKWETIYFPDPHKMDLALNYVKYVFSKQGMLDACSSHIESEFPLNNNGVSYAELFVDQMMHEYYTADGDELRCTKLAIQRIWQSLHAKACFADVFSTLLKHQLVPCLLADQQIQQQTHDFSFLPIVQDVIRAQRGVKGLLEQTVQAFMHLWMRFGPYAICNVNDAIKAEESVSNDVLGSIQGEMLELSNCLGVVISLLAWVYSKESNEGPDAIADICSRIIHCELGGTKYEMDPLLGAMTRDMFRKKLILRFLLSIQSEFVPQLRPKLADRLGIGALYNMIFACSMAT